jgi:hypothetical protein
MSRARLRRALPRIAALCVAAIAGAAPAHAQVFLASQPHPQFSIGPLFIVTVVQPDLTTVANVSFSLTLRPNVTDVEIDGDLFLLWPAEVSAANLPGAADPTLGQELERRGFAVLSSGRLALRSRDRMVVGTGAQGDPIEPGASFVTFNRRTAAAQFGGATYVKIPWTSKLVDSLNVVTLVLPLRGLILQKPATWLEETFWGRRWVLTVGFGDLGSPAQALYPFYFEQRERAVPLAREFSQIVANFTNSDHLRIESIAPAGATRRPSRVRAGNEVVTLPLNPVDSTAQNVKVEFSYFWGWIAWRPIVVSAILLLLSNVAGALMFGREVFTTMRARRRAQRLARRRRPPIEDATCTLAPGLTYDQVVERFGVPDEEHVEIVPNGRRTVVYRDDRHDRAEAVEFVLDSGQVTSVARRVRKFPVP